MERAAATYIDPLNKTIHDVSPEKTPLPIDDSDDDLRCLVDRSMITDTASPTLNKARVSPEKSTPAEYTGANFLSKAIAHIDAAHLEPYSDKRITKLRRLIAQLDGNKARVERDRKMLDKVIPAFPLFIPQPQWPGCLHLDEQDAVELDNPCLDFSILYSRLMIEKMLKNRNTLRAEFLDLARDFNPSAGMEEQFWKNSGTSPHQLATHRRGTHPLLVAPCFGCFGGSEVFSITRR